MAEEAAPDLTHDDEARLVQLAKERSPTAWAQIYDASYQKLFRYCYARTGDTTTAADLASRVFLEALEGIDRYVYRGRPLLASLPHRPQRGQRPPPRPRARGQSARGGGLPPRSACAESCLPGSRPGRPARRPSPADRRPAAGGRSALLRGLHHRRDRPSARTVRARGLLARSARAGRAATRARPGPHRPNG